MRWLALLISGPMLWAFLFSLIYALHGWACASGSGPEGLDVGVRMLLIGVWVLGLIAFIPLLRLAPSGQERHQRLPRMAIWIGLAATIVTLFPVTVITSC